MDAQVVAVFDAPPELKTQCRNHLIHGDSLRRVPRTLQVLGLTKAV